MKKKISLINVFTGICILVLIVIVQGVYFATNYKMVVLCLLTSLFCYSKLNLAFSLNKCHGINQFGKFRFWGFTMKQILVYLVVLAFIIYFIYLSFINIPNLHPLSIQNLRYFTLAMASSYCVSFLIWHFYWYNETFYLSEYDLRLTLKKRGYLQNDAEYFISTFKNDNLLCK